jgi:transposase
VSGGDLGKLRAITEDLKMAKPLLTDELWERIEPLLPPRKSSPKGGRPPVPDRAALTGILFVLRTGCPWEYLPQELNCGCGMTCWRRLRDWHEAGVWENVWRLLLDELGVADVIDWSKVAFDSCSVRAIFGGRAPDQTPRIAARMARNGILSATARARPWQWSTPGPMSTIRSKPLL